MPTNIRVALAWTGLLLTSLLLLSACGGGSGESDSPRGPGDTGQPAPGPPDPTENEATLSFSNQTSSSGLALAQFSGGVAAGDYDNDGHLDLYFVSGSGASSNRLYRNQGNGTFVNVTESAGVAVVNSKGSGPAFVDLNGDGWLDLFVGAMSGNPVFLFRNNGDGTFTDVTGDSGLEFAATNTVSASFGDLDSDGDLDALFTHWMNPVVESESLEILWLNESTGDKIQFTDQSANWGLDLAYESHYGGRNDGGNVPDSSFVASLTDFDADGDLDVLLVSDFGTTKVLRNDGNTLVNITNDNITDQHGMGSALGDYDNDGDIDWFVTSIHSGESETGGPLGGLTGNKLYRNDGDGIFTSVDAGVAAGGWGWGGCFADFNNDGLLDLFHVNGWTADNPLYDQYQGDFARLFIQQDDGTFEESSVATGLRDTGEGRGIACNDFDRDGDIDIVISNDEQAVSYWRNDFEAGHHYLTVSLSGSSANTQALGARIQVETLVGSVQVRELSASSNYTSTNAAEAHFGLGEQSNPVVVRVTWPDGAISTHPDITVDQHLIIPRSK